MWSPRKERTKNCEIMVAGSSANPATPLFQVDLRTPKPHSSRTQGKARQVIEEAWEYKARNLFDPVHTNPNMMSFHSIHPNSTRSMRELRIRTVDHSLVLVLTRGLASQGGKKKSPKAHAAPRPRVKLYKTDRVGIEIVLTVLRSTDSFCSMSTNIRCGSSKDKLHIRGK